MISIEKLMILTALQKLPKNGEDWGKLIVAKGFKKLPKVQNIAQSGHTGCHGWIKVIKGKSPKSVFAFASFSTARDSLIPTYDPRIPATTKSN